MKVMLGEPQLLYFSHKQEVLWSMWMEHEAIQAVGVKRTRVVLGTVLLGEIGTIFSSKECEA